MSPHDVVVTRIKEAFEKKGFLVQNRGNNLPAKSRRAEAIYRPDLLVRNRLSKDIAWIVEVETSDPGKSVAGAAILADVCMQIEMEAKHQSLKPNLLFVFYRSSANLQLAKKRLDRLTEKDKFHNLAQIDALTEKDAVNKIQSVASTIPSQLHS